MSPFMLKIAAKLLRRQVVAIRHFDGVVTYHIARTTPFGMQCAVLGQKCLLLPDGSVIGASWVDEWRAAQ
ncbi:hypothetical protein GCM10009097_55800 [Pigmentiphaga daeguensis]|uniref:Uncharacterized protein n=1 Tax=Pigmentiphaga daeguensis TaxID=414049 RepID=A0ABN1D0U7_9BURK